MKLFQNYPAKLSNSGDRFLAEIESVTPWTLLVTELEPLYPKGEGLGGLSSLPLRLS
jgi:hypothetical protein